ncbi:NADH-quinone oxidoreductase subunit H [bacterium]|nr:NADH-quinone oxidoreductase subunit H [bacterium]
MVKSLLHLLLFPGLIFQVVCGLLFDLMDRKFLARFQRRVGPPWFQPLADLLKLFGKEDLLPKGASDVLATLLPIISLSAVVTAGLYIPIAGFSLFSFEGDLIVIIFLMSVPTLAYYLAGISSVGVYSVMGAGRSLLQFFSYEVPLLIALTGPAILAGSWSVSGILAAQKELGPFIIFMPIGFSLAMVGMMGKLKRDPLDIPKAKSEVIGGSLTEFSGAKLGFWHILMDIQAVNGIFLIINLFFGVTKLNSILSFILFGVECLALVGLLSTASAASARLRIDQLAGLGWRILVPVGLAQLGFIILMGI